MTEGYTDGLALKPVIFDRRSHIKSMAETGVSLMLFVSTWNCLKNAGRYRRDSDARRGSHGLKCERK